MRSPFTSQFVVQVWNSAVLWAWIFNGLRVASGVLLLPLLVMVLPESDLGMYFRFLYLIALLPFLDLTLSATISRNISYAMGGAQSVQAIGIGEVQTAGPNVRLLAQLLSVTQVAYRWMAVALLAVLGLGGTLSIAANIQQTTAPGSTWLAWSLILCSAIVELYTGARFSVLRGMNKVTLASRISAGIYALKLVLSCVLLLAGFKLLAIGLATFISSIVQRVAAEYFLRRTLPAGMRPDPSSNRSLLKQFWPTSWRLGLHLLSIWFATNLSMDLLSRFLGLGVYAQYALSYQILYSIGLAISSSWTQVKWPLVSQLRAAGELGQLRRLLSARVWLQMLTLLGIAVVVVTLGPVLIDRWDPEKDLLARKWLAALALYTLLDMNLIFWTILISTENRIPFLWPTVITQLAGVAISVLLFKTTTLDVGGFVLGPLLSGLFFNFWYWPKRGARSIQTTWTSFMFGKKNAGIAALQTKTG